MHKWNPHQCSLSKHKCNRHTIRHNMPNNMYSLLMMMMSYPILILSFHPRHHLHQEVYRLVLVQYFLMKVI